MLLFPLQNTLESWVVVGTSTRNWRLGILGGFSLTGDGTCVALPPAGERIIAFLAIQKRPVNRLEIASITAAESTEERALGRLRTTLYRLTHTAAAPVLTSNRETVGLHPDVAVDLYDQAESISGIENGTLPDASQLDAALIEELLPGWYDDWVILARERNRQRQLHAIEAMADVLTRRCSYARALDLGLHAVERDPLRESAHRSVIVVHLAEGNLHAAVTQYRAYLAHLAEAGLGPRPSSRLSAMIAPCLALAG
jgi:DNA-binding SARP family transcriptional activator